MWIPLASHTHFSEGVQGIDLNEDELREREERRKEKKKRSLSEWMENGGREKTNEGQVLRCEDDPEAFRLKHREWRAGKLKTAGWRPRGMYAQEARDKKRW